MTATPAETDPVDTGTSGSSGHPQRWLILCNSSSDTGRWTRVCARRRSR
jgi:hypothetical protein